MLLTPITETKRQQAKDFGTIFKGDNYVMQFDIFLKSQNGSLHQVNSKNNGPVLKPRYLRVCLSIN